MKKNILSSKIETGLRKSIPLLLPFKEEVCGSEACFAKTLDFNCIRWMSCFVATFILMVTSGCTTTEPVTGPPKFEPQSQMLSQVHAGVKIPVNRISIAPGQTPSPLPALPAYVLMPEDEIEVKFHFQPEFNDRMKIRPDGKISLQLIDEVMASGLTPVELDKVLSEKYSKVLVQPELTVIVRNFSGRNVFVGGEVGSPGMIPIKGPLTALQAILQAGGLKNTSEMKNIILLRNQGSKQPLFAKINLDEGVNHTLGKNDIYLKPFDVVFVPKSDIATVNQFVEQYINKLIPNVAKAGFSWIYTLNPTFSGASTLTQ
ncbi:MAG: polysaccharide export protein [Candidatus Nitronauta litoralis]|uniref:Polysaccharide export protein n=1 Tax=Candidatus Nitronauta litoralis TaxID=2705533 RepID=A0A7T0BXA5_9BACT|nr:MAG: polysaccharide export protein [Candidatus Nitronauta litoralis]